MSMKAVFANLLLMVQIGQYYNENIKDRQNEYRTKMGNSIKLHIFSYCMTGMIRPETSGILTGGPEKTSQKGKNAVII